MAGEATFGGDNTGAPIDNTPAQEVEETVEETEEEESDDEEDEGTE